MSDLLELYETENAKLKALLLSLLQRDDLTQEVRDLITKALEGQ